jgi:zinc protease
VIVEWLWWIAEFDALHEWGIISLNFDAASSTDGEKYGLASLTNSLLSSATRYHNEEQIINAFESLGAQFSNYSLKDMSIVKNKTKNFT